MINSLNLESRYGNLSLHYHFRREMVLMVEDEFTISWLEFCRMYHYISDLVKNDVLVWDESGGSFVRK